VSKETLEMSLGSERSKDEWRAELQARAEQVWGEQRLAALEPALDAAAQAVRRLAQAPLEPLEAEPDFIGGAVNRVGER
jgi:hypothetical protein